MASPPKPTHRKSQQSSSSSLSQHENGENRSNVWEGAIPLQIHLHDSEVTIHPPPPPALILASRVGYLPLLQSQVRPHFSSTLPPGQDTIWFEYRGLPLKWYIPIGVLFDLLCAEAEIPWNLTVHFRGYPGNVLIPCEGEESVKWNYINALKEAAYIINGNCKNVMNMSQPDQAELWNSVLNGNIEAYYRVSSKLKLRLFGDEFTSKSSSGLIKTRQSISDTDNAGQSKTDRIPVRLYVFDVTDDFDDLEDAPQIDSWDKISYINRPVEYQEEVSGKYFTLLDALKTVLPELFATDEYLTNEEDSNDCVELEMPSPNAEIKLIRIQGIEPKLEIPFSWVVNNLMNPEHFLHICLYIKVSNNLC